MPPTTEVPVLAIDGPSGTGKGTVSTAIADRLGWHYLDSGAIYRVFGWIADENGISAEDVDQLSELSSGLRIRFGAGDEQGRIWCNGRELDPSIRGERGGELASRYAAVPRVRSLLMTLQRSCRRPPGLVADGRDMGTTVFPDAALKIYLDARAEVRAERRYKQLKEKGFDGSLARLREEMEARDARDATRSASPLAMAGDAVRIDTSEMAIDEVVAAVLARLPASVGISRPG